MSVANLCRLCVKLCGADARSLYDDIGQKNETYEIAIQYFHPMYLHVDEGNVSTVVCPQCWQHIFSFHTFQQVVFEAQRQLLIEETDIDIQTSVWDKGAFHEFANAAQNTIDETVSLPDLEIIEDLSFYGNNDQHSEDLGDCQSLVTNVPNGSLCVSESTTYPDSLNSVREANSHQASQSKIRKRRRSVAEMDKIIAFWRPTLNCGICTKPCECFKLLRQHFKSMHPEEPFYVTCCGLIFNIRSKFVQHVLSHSDSICCQICDVRLGSKAALDVHNRFCHTYSNEQPKILPQKKKHMSRNTVYAQIDDFIARYLQRLQCILCNETYVNFPLLKAHFTQQHPGEEFYVECCKRKFSTRWKLKEHISVHLDPDVFKCKKCGKRSTSYLNLQSHCLRIHSRQRHSQRGLKPSTTVRNRVSYKTYDSRISQWKPFIECNICHQTWTTFTRLQSHFRKKHHTDEFYVVCCEQKFYTRPVYLEHLRLHSNPDAFKCQVCNKSYKFQKSYVDHIRLRHPEINVYGLFKAECDK